MARLGMVGMHTKPACKHSAEMPQSWAVVPGHGPVMHSPCPKVAEGAQHAWPGRHDADVMQAEEDPIPPPKPPPLSPPPNDGELLEVLQETTATAIAIAATPPAAEAAARCILRLPSCDILHARAGTGASP
jgi:hypothetical protein